jgi:hypothetical protein
MGDQQVTAGADEQGRLVVESASRSPEPKLGLALLRRFTAAKANYARILLALAEQHGVRTSIEGASQVVFVFDQMREVHRSTVTALDGLTAARSVTSNYTRSGANVDHYNKHSEGIENKMVIAFEGEEVAAQLAACGALQPAPLSSLLFLMYKVSSQREACLLAKSQRTACPD